MAANEDKLNLLHEKITDLFLEMLEVSESDESLALPAATLKTMTSFLKDNEITCQMDTGNVGKLRDRLRNKPLTEIPVTADTLFH